MSLSRQCSCYHEAGHAVAWVVNGDSLLLVVGHGDARLTSEQEALRNAVLVSHKDDHLAFVNRLLQRRRSAGETIRKGKERSACEECKSTELSDACPACVKVLVDHLCCIFAGGAATALLLRDEHVKSQMSDDLAQINNALQKFLPKDEPQRQELRSRAEQHADSLIRRETTAVRALADQLLVDGVLNGPIAEQIIRRNLRSPTA